MPFQPLNKPMCIWSFSMRMEMGPVNSSDTDLSPGMWIVSLKSCRQPFSQTRALPSPKTPNQADLMHPTRSFPTTRLTAASEESLCVIYRRHPRSSQPCLWAPAFWSVGGAGLKTTGGPFLLPKSLALFMTNWFLPQGADAKCWISEIGKKYMQRKRMGSRGTRASVCRRMTG